MMISLSNAYKFLWLLFLCFFYNNIEAQKNTLSSIYNKKIEAEDYNISKKEFLIDSLLHEKNIIVDTLQLVEIYRNILKDLRFTNLKKSFAYIEKIENIAIKLGDPNIKSFKKNRLNEIVFLYQDQKYNQCLAAIEAFLIRYSTENQDHGKVYRIAGNVYSKLGDFQKAIDNYDKSILIYGNENNNKNLYKTLVSKLELLVSAYDVSYLNEVFSIEKDLDSIDSQKEIKTNDKIATYWNLGSFYDSNKLFYKAKENYQKSLKLSEFEEDSTKISISLMNLGIISEKEDNLKSAKNYLNKASQFANEDAFLLSMISNNFADIYQKENDHRKALEFYQKAITQALKIDAMSYEKLPAFQDIEFSANKIDVLGYLIDKANGWIAFYNAEKKPTYLENALETFALADALIDNIYVESREDLSKLFWRKKGATFYPKAVEVCYQLQKPEKAFFFMEKNKAMLLLEHMTNATAKRLSKLPENILLREQFLVKEIKTLTSEIQYASVNEHQKTDSLKNRIFEYKKQYNAFIDSLEINYPKYYRYKKNINVVTLDEVQQNMKKDEVILQYIIGKEKSFATLILSDDIELEMLPETQQLIENSTQFLEAVSKPFVNTEDKKAYAKIAKQLYRELLPFQDLASRFIQKKVTIIADGILQYIPFEALVSQHDNYFIKNNQIHYNYSLSSAAQSQQNDAVINEDFIAIAPTNFKNNQFEALKTGEAELKRLTNIFDANHYQYAEATKAQFVEAYGHYKIIHLSTHGGIQNTVPWLAFYDEKMTLDELYFTKNQSELVVLSACKTSDGALQKGEGVMSLARGFFNAGAKSVVSSLWDINEKASSDIIHEFYKNITDGDSKSEALQKAKLNYIENHKNTSEASPYYWSGLTITGDVQPIKNVQKNTYLYYSFAGIFLVIIGFSVHNRRKKRKTG